MWMVASAGVVPVGALVADVLASWFGVGGAVVIGTRPGRPRLRGAPRGLTR